MPLDKKTVIFIVGPTAIGKTALSIKLAGRVNGEIISADSMQVYKSMRTLSQSPQAAQIKKVRYHLVGFLNPQREFSAAAFTKKAAVLIDDITRRGKMPIVAGGTGLYIKCLVDGLFPSPKADLKFRKKMYGYAARYGSAGLHNKLKDIDAEAARSIHPNDTRRIVRAFEIWRLTGRTMTELKAMTKGISGKYRIKMFGLTARREYIYSNINKRVDKMLEQGMVEEVKKLSKKNLSRTAKAVLGYKEIISYLKGECDLRAAKELVKRNTRRFAKRQLTWFRGDKRIKWVDVSKSSQREIVRRIIEALG